MKKYRAQILKITRNDKGRKATRVRTSFSKERKMEENKNNLSKE